MSDALKNYAISTTEYAYEFCKKLNSSKSFVQLLKGEAIFKIEAFPSSGHNQYLVVDSIYYLYQNKLNDIDQLYGNALLTMSKNINDIFTFQSVMFYIILQLENQKKGLSPFKIDMRPILNNVKEQMEQIRDTKEFLDYEEVYVRYNNSLKEEFGQKIL